MKNQYKISISIFFGLLGFFINFHTIIFPFGEYTVAILLGLLFPMLITLSWGWKYGLLSALAGGCQTMWLLWGPSNGYAIFFVAPLFTLWIIWHGIFAELRKKQKTYKWWLSMYVVEIPFRILSSINLLTLSRWAITFNPPIWNWCSNAPNTIPMHFSVFVTIKQAAVGLIILLLADVLLNIKHVRIFFKLKEYVDYKKTGYIISTFLLFGCLFWLLDSVIYSFAFNKEISFLDLLALNIPDYNIFIRTVFFIFCLVCGLITSRILRRQKEGEIALKESEEKFRSYVENAPFGIFVADEKGNYIDVNEAACRITGYSRTELLNKNLVELIPPEDHSYVKKHFETVVKTGISTGDMSFVKKDGSKNIWTVDAVKLSDNRFLGFVTDITDRKQAEEELKKHREHLEELVKERTAELEEKTGKLEKFQKSLTLLLNDVNESREELGKMNKYLKEKTGKLEESQRSLTYLLEDVNEARAELENVNKQLENANKELEAFSYSVSHDLRAPLRAIDGFSRLILEDYYDTLDDEGKESLNIIRNNAKLMGQLIDDLLEFSRLGRKSLKSYPIKLKEMINEIFQEQRNLFPDRIIDIKFKSIPNIKADSSMIRQVIVNLVSNAIKFTEKKERSIIEFGSKENENEIIYYIKDNGVGFDMKYVDKLFGVFQRLHSREEFEGTGVGLALIKRIINKHGGRVWAEGEVDKGATFYFSMPVGHA